MEHEKLIINLQSDFIKESIEKDPGAFEEKTMVISIDEEKIAKKVKKIQLEARNNQKQVKSAS